MHYIALLGNATTTTPSAHPVPASTTTTTAAAQAATAMMISIILAISQKIDDDAHTGWKRKTLNITDYLKLENDKYYVPLRIILKSIGSIHYF